MPSKPGRDNERVSQIAYREALANGQNITVYQPGAGTVPENGKVYLEGPHYPAPHSWYAVGTMVDGKLTKVV